MNKQNKSNKTSCEPDIHKTDYEAVKEEISRHNWDDELTSTFEADYDHCISVQLICMEKHSPKKIPPKKRKNIFMTNEALRLKNTKHKLWKKFISSRSNYDRNKYNSCKNSLRKLTRKLRRDFECNLARNAKEKPKLFWGYTKTRLKTKQRIPSLTKADGSTATTPKEKSEVLNQFFSSVFTVEDL